MLNVAALLDSAPLDSPMRSASFGPNGMPHPFTSSVHDIVYSTFEGRMSPLSPSLGTTFAQEEMILRYGFNKRLVETTRIRQHYASRRMVASAAVSLLGPVCFRSLFNLGGVSG